MLAEGRTAERGTHADLLRRDGLYAAMWQRQQHSGDDDEPIEPLDLPLETA